MMGEKILAQEYDFLTTVVGASCTGIFKEAHKLGTPVRSLLFLFNHTFYNKFSGQKLFLVENSEILFLPYSWYGKTKIFFEKGRY